MFPFPGPTHDLLCSAKEILSLLQLYPLYHSKVWLTPLSCSFCSCCSFHGTCIFSMLGSSAETRLDRWPPLCSLKGAKPHLFCMTNSCIRNQYHLGDSYTWPSPAAPLGPTLVISGTHLLCHSENTTQNISPQWCWFLLHHLYFLNYSYPALSH